MKDYITITLTLLAGAIISSMPLAAQTSLLLDPHRFDVPGDPPSVTYLVEEDFEGTGAPDNWVVPNPSFTPEWDETTLAILGDESVSMVSSSYSAYTPSFSEQTELHIFFAMRVGDGSSNINIVRLRGADASLVVDFQYRNTGTFRIIHGSATSTSGVIGAGVYYVWLTFTAGSGSNGGMTCYIDTDQDKTGGTELTAITTGTVTAGCDQVQFAGQANGVQYDKIRIDDQPIGANPP